MAALEQLVLDGLALNDITTYRLQGLETPPPPKRYEWATGGDADGAALVRDPLHEIRVVTAKIRVTPTTRDSAATAISAIVAKIEEAEKQPDGLDLVWTPSDGTKVGTFKVLAGEITDLPIDWESGWLLKTPSPILTVVLQCKPFMYGSEVVGSATSSATPFVTVTVANVAGDVPAEGRLIITDAATQLRRHLEWGLEQRYYNAATSLLVDSDNMTAGTTAVQTTRTGAYDPNATGNNVIRATLYANNPSTVCTTGTLGHAGTFRVKARVYAAGTGPADVQLSWQEGDGPFRANALVQISTMNSWYEIDLGVISIPPAVSGTQKWSGRIDAHSVASGDTVDIDYLILVPAGEGYGKGRTVPATTQSGVNLSGFDSFAGLAVGTVLNARTAPLGGVWATSGVATDFVGGSNPADTVTRSTAVAEATPRYAILGATSYTDAFAKVYWIFSASGIYNNPPHNGALILRWTDANNYLRVFWSGNTGIFAIETVVAGAVTRLASRSAAFGTSTFYGIQAFAWATGTVKATLMGPGDAEILSVVGTSTVLATGGTLATGKVGFSDQATSTTVVGRNYDGFVAGVPAAENPVIVSGRSAEIRSNSAIRADSTNTYWGPLSSYRGSRFLVPPAGTANRTSRVLAKANRLDVDTDAATNVTDNLTVQVAVTPRYLVVPR